MSVLTCKLPLALEVRLADLARRRGVPKSVLVREAIEAKVAKEAAAFGTDPRALSRQDSRNRRREL
jgi:predicted DNA-binding protein